MKVIKGLFAMNERVVLNGEWKHGFFSYSPVGAYNVGSMSLNFEEVSSIASLRSSNAPQGFDTNLKDQKADSPPQKKTYENEIQIRRGENVGFFNLGSSLVLLWESPPVVFKVCSLTKTLTDAFVEGQR